MNGMVFKAFWIALLHIEQVSPLAWNSAFSNCALAKNGVAHMKNIISLAFSVFILFFWKYKIVQSFPYGRGNLHFNMGQSARCSYSQYAVVEINTGRAPVWRRMIG